MTNMPSTTINDFITSLDEGDQAVVEFLLDYFENSDSYEASVEFPTLYHDVELGDDEDEGVELESPYSNITINDIIKHVLFMCKTNRDDDDIACEISELSQNLPYNSH